MRKKVKIAVVVAVVALAFVLGWFSSNPPTSCKIDISGEWLDAIQSQSKGLYSKILPLVPIYISVDSCSGETVFYRIYYFPFGTVDMSYNEEDGYNIEKPLTSH